MIEVVDINSQTKKKEETISQNYVKWEGQRVEIPKSGYLPCGRHTPYTPEKVLSTLDFYHTQILKNNFKEARDEEFEEMHHPSLLNIVLLVSVYEQKDLAKKLPFKLRSRLLSIVE